VSISLRDVNSKHGKHVRGIGAEVLDIFMGTRGRKYRELRNVWSAPPSCAEGPDHARMSAGEFGKSAGKALATYPRSSSRWYDVMRWSAC